MHGGKPAKTKAQTKKCYICLVKPLFIIKKHRSHLTKKNMATIVANLKVKNYQTWKPLYDAGSWRREAAGLKLYWSWLFP